MEAVLVVGIIAFVLLLVGGGEAQPATKLPRVVYVVAEPSRSEAGGGGCLLLAALAMIVLLAFGLPG